MKPYISTLCLSLLSLACASRSKDVPHSTLVTRRCGHAATGDSSAAISVKIEPRRARNDYLQLTVSVVRSGVPDSVIAHVVRDLDTRPTIRPGLYRLRVRSLGYQTATDTLRVAASESWCVTARLSDAVALAPVQP
jgi:hypothetical protein